MEVNQVRFGNYSIGSKSAQAGRSGGAQKDESVKEEKKEQLNAQVEADNIFNALDIAGLQNKMQINAVSQKEVNPKNYLSEERIQDIEAMMGDFEAGVNSVANIIESEFPGVFANDAKNALAASIFAQG